MFYVYSVGTTKIVIAVKDPSRTALTIRNNHASNTLYLGTRTNCNSTSGFPIPAGGSVSFSVPEDDPTEEVYAVGSGAATDVRVYEGFGGNPG